MASWLNWLDRLSKRQEAITTEIFGLDKLTNSSVEINAEKVGNRWHLKTINDIKSPISPLIDNLNYNIVLKQVPNRIGAVGPNGRIYAGFSSYIQYSDDDGATWSGYVVDDTDIPTYRQLMALETGELLILGVAGEIWKSDVNQANWTQKLADVGGSGFEDGGFKRYENVIVACNYGADLVSLQVWLSTDYGDTWTQIMNENPAVGWNHMHDVVYDPYENIIWACNGDDYTGYVSNVSRVWYTADYGAHWEWIGGVRATAIIPLPDRVLFLSDMSGRQSVFCHERPSRGTNIIRSVRPATYTDSMGFISTEEWRPPYGIKEIFFGQVYESELSTAAACWGTNPYIKYGKDYKSLFGYRPNGKPIILWGTTDGTRFIPLWKSNKNVSNGYGIGGVYGTEDKLVVAVNMPDATEVLKNYMLILTPKV